MNVFTGIDLGSTTCKAIVLDEAGAVLGKGITNTRSNYTMATQIATHEALTNARFTLMLLAGLFTAEQRDSYEIRYHQEDYLNKHAQLQERLQAVAASRGKSAWAGVLSDMGRFVDDALLLPETEAAIADRSKFFKDLAYAFYMQAIERFLPAGDLLGETFLGMLDKVLVAIENEVFPLDPLDVLARVLPDKQREIMEVSSQDGLEVKSQVGTGYGRQLLPFPEEQIRSEILCHAKGAHYMYPNTHTVLDIGGQDTKAIQLDDQGLVRSFFMNDRCAAGCGRYLGYVAEELAIGLGELGPTACRACRHIPISSTCTVFAGAELRDLLYAGEAKEEVLLGLHRAIVLRAMSLLARSGGVFNELTFTGGVAKNQAVVQVLRDLVAKNYGSVLINIDPDSIYTGALGAALYARSNGC